MTFVTLILSSRATSRSKFSLSLQLQDGLVEFCADILCSQRMSLEDFGDPLTFPLAPP